MSCTSVNIVPDFGIGTGGGSTAGVTSLEGLLNDVNLTSTGNTVAITTSGQNINLEATSPVSSFVPAFSLYVSTNGNDTTGDGSSLNPYQTIGKAILQRATLANNVVVEVLVYAGQYAENLTINTGNIIITGFSSAYDILTTNSKPVRLTGNVTVDITVTNTNATTSVALVNLSLVSSTISTTSTVAQTLNFYMSNCRMSGNIINYQNSFQGASSFYDRCYIINTSPSSLLVLIGVNCTVLNCEFQQSDCSQNPVINLQQGNSAGGVILMRYSKVRCTDATTSVFPLVRYQNSGANTASVFSYNEFTYTSSAVDTSGNKCCIQFNNSFAMTVTAMIFNTFDCDGASYTGGQPYAVQKRGAGSVTVLLIGANYGGAGAHTLDPAIIKTSQMILL
jgi:hypothetical protein